MVGSRTLGQTADAAQQSGQGLARSRAAGRRLGSWGPSIQERGLPPPSSTTHDARLDYVLSPELERAALPTTTRIIGS